MAFCGLPWMLKILGSCHLFDLELWLPALLHLWYLHSVLTSAGGDICWALPSLSICRYSPNSTTTLRDSPGRYLVCAFSTAPCSQYPALKIPVLLPLGIHSLEFRQTFDLLWPALFLCAVRICPLSRKLGHV